MYFLSLGVKGLNYRVPSHYCSPLLPLATAHSARRDGFWTRSFCLKTSDVSHSLPLSGRHPGPNMVQITSTYRYTVSIECVQFWLQRMHWTNLSVSIEAKNWASWPRFDAKGRWKRAMKLPRIRHLCSNRCDSKSRWLQGRKAYSLGPTFFRREFPGNRSVTFIFPVPASLPQECLPSCILVACPVVSSLEIHLEILFVFVVINFRRP